MTAPAARGHVAILTSNFWPEPTGSGRTTTEFARFLAGRAIEVRVATAMPYFPQWRIWEGYRGRWWVREQLESIVVRRSWHFVRPRPTTLGRLLHETTLVAFSVPVMLRTLWGARAAYIVSPALGYAFVASVLAACLRVRRVLVVQDVMPDTAVELGMLRNPLVIAVSRMMARAAYRLADEIHTVGEGMRRRIAATLERDDKLRFVPNTVDVRELAPVAPADNAFRARYVPSGTFTVLQYGNMGKKQDLDLILRVADRMREDPGTWFVVCGDGAERERFLARMRRLALPNLTYLPLQERRMLPHMLSGVDLVLVSQQPEVVDIVVPSKILTALACGAVIVAACDPASEAARLVADGRGIVIPPGDDDGLMRTVEHLASGAGDVPEIRRRARAYAVEHLDREAVYGPVAERLETVGPDG